MRSSELLPERALAGDGHARRHLIEEIYLPLAAAKGTLIETLSAYFHHGSSMEATARALFVHPSTVRPPSGGRAVGPFPVAPARRVHAPDRARWAPVGQRENGTASPL